MTTQQLPPLTERDFQRAVTQLAELRGWHWYHPRAARTMDSWRTPASGTMASGWPDLVLVRDRVLFRELKRENGQLTEGQREVLAALTAAGQDAKVWRPTDWAEILEALTLTRGGQVASIGVPTNR